MKEKMYLLGSESAELGAFHDDSTLAENAAVLGDLARSHDVVARHHANADAGLLTLRNGRWNLRTYGVLDANNPDKDKVLVRDLGFLDRRASVREELVGEADGAESLVGVLDNLCVNL